MITTGLLRLREVSIRLLANIGFAKSASLMERPAA